VSGDEILVARDGAIVTLTFNRPAARNALTWRMYEGLTRVCEEVDADDTVRVLVLRGAGGQAFVAGTDISQFQAFAGAPDGVAYERDGDRRMGRLEAVRKPVIAAIQGFAVGAGLRIAAACDLRIAAEGARFGLLQARAGFMPCDGGTQRLSRIVGKAKALEMILTGETIDSREALRIGLVNRVVPEEEVVKTVMDMAGEMVSRAPVAMRFAKEAVLNGMDMTLEQGLRLEADLYFLLHTTRDRTDGITAFREKKKPRFEGK